MLVAIPELVQLARIGACRHDDRAHPAGLDDHERAAYAAQLLRVSAYVDHADWMLIDEDEDGELYRWTFTLTIAEFEECESYSADAAADEGE